MGHTCWAGPTDPSRSLQTEGGTEEHCSGTEPPLPHFLLSADDRPLRQKVQHFKYNAIKYVFAIFLPFFMLNPLLPCPVSIRYERFYDHDLL